MAGNADDGGKKSPFAGGIEGTGAQALAPSIGPKAFQNPGGPTPVGSFAITQLGQPADKVGKDTNFRGLTIYDNVVYYTKGSGGNGVNTVYFIDTTGKACPSGVGLPQPGAALPSAPIAYDPTKITTQGVAPYNMCILAGFPTTLASASSGVSFPFGIWFANADTLYVADEGSNTDTYDSTTKTWTDPLDSTRGPAEVGLQLEHAAVAARLHAAERPEPGRALHGGGVPDRSEQRARWHGSAVGTGDERPAQRHGSRQPERDGDDLG